MKKILLLCAAALALAACGNKNNGEDDKPGGVLPQPGVLTVDVLTGEAFDVDQYTAILNGSYVVNVPYSKEGDAGNIVDMYFYLSATFDTSDDIRARGNKIDAGHSRQSRDEFLQAVMGLNASTTYYFVASVTLDRTEYLGEVRSFRTADVPPREESVTGNATEITEVSATLSGYAYTSPRMGQVTAGIVYSLLDMPAIGNGTALVASGIDENGQYSVTATDLTPETTYYFRSYLQFGSETLYGEVQYFTTTAVSAQVTTLPAENIGLFAATVGGSLQVNSQGDFNKFVWIHFGTSSNAEELKSSGTLLQPVLQADGTFTYPVSGLNYNTTYYYIAGARVYENTFYGNVVSFKTLDLTASVTTGSATDVEIDSATLNGSLSAPGTESLPQSVWFLFGETASLEALKSSGARMNANLQPDGSFTYSIVGLNYNSTYYYVACAEVDGRQYYGTPVSFKTKDLEVSVTTVEASEIGEEQGTMNGSVTVGGGLSVSEVWFLWGESNDLNVLISEDRHINATLRGDNTFIYTLRGRTPNSTTYYVACAKVNRQNFYGEVKGLTTTDKTIVDLGLSVRWRSINIPQTDTRYPEVSGSCIAWGSVTIDYCNWAHYCWGTSPTSLMKYNTKSEYGKVDNKTVLDLEDDVAHRVLGGNWRMPTDAEWTELRENCTFSAETINGKNGIRVRGKNGNSIFLPCAGYMLDLERQDEGTGGYYWSSSLVTDEPSHAHSVHFFKNNTVILRSPNGAYRHFGMSIRPVTK